jgi:hypothetical protein
MTTQRYDLRIGRGRSSRSHRPANHCEWYAFDGLTVEEADDLVDLLNYRSSKGDGDFHEF